MDLQGLMAQRDNLLLQVSNLENQIDDMDARGLQGTQERNDLMDRREDLINQLVPIQQQLQNMAPNPNASSSSSVGGALGDEDPTNYDDDFDAELEGITRGISRTDIGRDREDRPARPIPDSKVADETAGSKEEHKREDAMEGVKEEASAGGKSGGIDDSRKRGRDDEGGAGAKRQREGTPTGGSFIPSRGRTKLNHKVRGGAINPMVDKSNILYQDPSKETTEAGKVAAGVANALAPSLLPDASKAMTAVSKVPFIGNILPMVL